MCNSLIHAWHVQTLKCSSFCPIIESLLFFLPWVCYCFSIRFGTHCRSLWPRTAHLHTKRPYYWHKKWPTRVYAFMCHWEASLEICQNEWVFSFTILRKYNIWLLNFNHSFFVFTCHLENNLWEIDYITIIVQPGQQQQQLLILLMTKSKLCTIF